MTNPNNDIDPVRRAANDVNETVVNAGLAIDATVKALGRLHTKIANDPRLQYNIEAKPVPQWEGMAVWDTDWGKEITRKLKQAEESLNGCEAQIKMQRSTINDFRHQVDNLQSSLNGKQEELYRLEQIIRDMTSEDRTPPWHTDWGKNILNENGKRVAQINDLEAKYEKLDEAYNAAVSDVGGMHNEIVRLKGELAKALAPADNGIWKQTAIHNSEKIMELKTENEDLKERIETAYEKYELANAAYEAHKKTLQDVKHSLMLTKSALTTSERECNRLSGELECANASIKNLCEQRDKATRECEKFQRIKEAAIADRDRAIMDNERVRKEFQEHSDNQKAAIERRDNAVANLEKKLRELDKVATGFRKELSDQDTKIKNQALTIRKIEAENELLRFQVQHADPHMPTPCAPGPDHPRPPVAKCGDVYIGGDVQQALKKQEKKWYEE